MRGSTLSPNDQTTHTGMELLIDYECPELIAHRFRIEMSEKLKFNEAPRKMISNDHDNHDDNHYVVSEHRNFYHLVVAICILSSNGIFNGNLTLWALLLSVTLVISLSFSLCLPFSLSICLPSHFNCHVKQWYFGLGWELDQCSTNANIGPHHIIIRIYIYINCAHNISCCHVVFIAVIFLILIKWDSWTFQRAYKHVHSVWNDVAFKDINDHDLESIYTNIV